MFVKTNGYTTTLLGIILIMALTHASPANEPKVIFSFEKENSADNWVSVNDGVMGGVSTGKVVRTKDKTLRFTGNLSLENNGGFASIRSKTVPFKLNGVTALVIKVKGDGRTYWVGTRTADQLRASSYRAYLKTEKDVVQETIIPLSDLKLQAFGRDLPGKPLDAAAIASLGFTIADKKPGPFKLDILSIKAAFGNLDVEPTSAESTIIDVATKAGTFKTLLSAVEAAGLKETLAGDGPFTLFAPTDDAFATLPEETLKSLLKPENKDQLVALLKYHVAAGRVSLPEALKMGDADTLAGQAVSIAFSKGRVRIGASVLLSADIPASNGVIHVIDTVMIPSSPAKQPLTPEQLVTLAIDRGVPLFNDGNPAACAAVYEVVCEALCSMPGVSETSKKDLAAALIKQRAETSASDKAWILRKALDQFIDQR